MFYQNPEFWVAVGFLLFLGLLGYMGVHKQLGGALDSHGAKIRAQLDEAARLRAEAETLLKDAQRRYAAADADAATIVEQSRAAAATLAAKADTDLATTIARRSADAETRIATAERAAIGSLRARVADLATKAAARVIAEDTDAGLHARLADQAIGDLGRRLN